MMLFYMVLDRVAYLNYYFFTNVKALIKIRFMSFFSFLFDAGWKCANCGETAGQCENSPNPGFPGCCQGRKGQVHHWVRIEKKSKEKNKVEIQKETSKKKSFWKPVWAIPFKVIFLPFKIIFWITSVR